MTVSKQKNFTENKEKYMLQMNLYCSTINFKIYINNFV